MCGIRTINQLAAVGSDALTGKQAPQKRNAAQSGDAGPPACFLLVDQAAQQVHFSLVHADILRNLALPIIGWEMPPKSTVRLTLEMSRSMCIETSPLSCTRAAS